MDTSTARDLLLAERARLRGILDSGVSEFGRNGQDDVTLMSYEAQPADAARETLEREERLSVLGHADAELGEVDHALEKLANGTYGTCEECGKAIPDERLEARPATRFCIDHQKLDEKRAGVGSGRGTQSPTAGDGDMLHG